MSKTILKRPERLEGLKAPTVTVTDGERAKALALFSVLEPDERERRLLEAPLFIRGLVSKAGTILTGGRHVSLA